jgi:hypothetical protein
MNRGRPPASAPQTTNIGARSTPRPSLTNQQVVGSSTAPNSCHVSRVKAARRRFYFRICTGFIISLAVNIVSTVYVVIRFNEVNNQPQQQQQQPQQLPMVRFTAC